MANIHKKFLMSFIKIHILHNLLLLRILRNHFEIVLNKQINGIIGSTFVFIHFTKNVDYRWQIFEILTL